VWDYLWKKICLHEWRLKHQVPCSQHTTRNQHVTIDPLSDISISFHSAFEETCFGRASCDRTESKGFKPYEGRFRLDISKKFFTKRLVKHCHRLPREAAYAPSLETFKVRVNGALSNPIKLKMSLLTTRGLG